MAITSSTFNVKKQLLKKKSTKKRQVYALKEDL